ncbi:hypothetical protein [Myroides sp. DW712]|uniref:hypothetical protein n=1 Tax=Myroides sp. DW712 TaxID=3389800 RepID=UPI003978B988
MKKVLEGELLSIVHRVLQMKDTDVDKLYVEAKELYEKLQILKFYQDNLALGLVNDIAEDQLVAKLSAFAPVAKEPTETLAANVEEEEERSQIPADLIVEDYPLVVEAEKETVIDFESPALSQEEKEEGAVEETEEEHTTLVFEEEEEDAVEEEIEEEEEEDVQTEEDMVRVLEEEELTDQAVAEVASETPIESNVEAKEEAVTFTPLTGDQREDNPFEGFDFGEIEFIRVEDVAKEDAHIVDDSMFERVVAEQAQAEEENQSTDTFFAQQQVKEEESKEEEDKAERQQNMLFNLDQVSVREPRIVKTAINDIYRGTIMVGLNDRIAFEKHLFANSSEDFNRVLSQLNTVSTYEEARSFVEHLVKPEYNNWEGKDEYAERFMALIEKRFE